MTECEICQRTENLVKHHTNYKEDTTIKICRKCHYKIHRKGEFGMFFPIDESEYTMFNVKKETWKELQLLKLEKEHSSINSLIIDMIKKEREE